MGVSSEFVFENEGKKDEELRKVIYMSSTGKDYRAHFNRRDEEAYRAFQQSKLDVVPV